MLSDNDFISAYEPGDFSSVVLHAQFPKAHEVTVIRTLRREPPDHQSAPVRHGLLLFFDETPVTVFLLLGEFGEVPPSI